MIIKAGEEVAWEHWMRRDNRVKVFKIPQDQSQVETSLGWVTANRGDYLLEIAPNIRSVLSYDALASSYQPICDVQDCAERRQGERRQNQAPRKNG